MNTPENSQKHTMAVIGQTCDIIKERLTESQARFDIFAFLPSSTVWQSPVELARTWIEGVAPEAWKYMQEHSNINEKVAKDTIRRMLLDSTAKKITFLGQNPTTHQKVSTRLFIKQILASELSVQDQDRIIAAELGVSFRTWQQILGTFTLNPELYILLKTSGTIQILLDIEGNLDCQLSHFESDTSIDIPGIKKGKTQVTNRTKDAGEKSLPLARKMGKLHISQGVLERYDNIIGMDQMKNNIRNTIFERTQMSAWKRRGGGGNRPKESHVPDGKLVY